ncbi:hypothetical protein SAMN05444166_0855 [Singulisphaera sp. GP187]|uniref:hypothetical protein n=1 Tax=Singulisphaera sp. GP187 TaxID=1882752 RepID=UPI000929D4C1|nr:hypothetical protein [Singulisphaera sp. GP187]SIN78794.1 hypothetical protein SAMN05444166_0855 [Singulisphaera sp. GP187]
MRRPTMLAAFLGLGLVGGIAVMAQRPAVRHVSPPMAIASAPVALPAELQPARTSAPLPLPEIEPAPAFLTAEQTLPQPQGDLAQATEPAPSERKADDPMDALKAFHEQSRKKAQDQIKSLTEEAEALRSRLQRVEAALEGWKAVGVALEQEPGERPVPSVRKGFWKSEEEIPTDLTPAPIEQAPVASPNPVESSPAK